MRALMVNWFIINVLTIYDKKTPPAFVSKLFHTHIVTENG
jgi:hypothetical protein